MATNIYAAPYGTIYSATPGAGLWLIDCQSTVNTAASTITLVVTVGGRTVYGNGVAYTKAAGITSVGYPVQVLAAAAEAVTITIQSSNSLDTAVTLNTPTAVLQAIDVGQLLGTAPTEDAAGRLAAALTKFGDVATPAFTAASVNQTGDSYADPQDSAGVTQLLTAGGMTGTGQSNKVSTSSGAMAVAFACNSMTRTLWAGGHRQRIRQSGTISAVRVNFPSVTNFTSVLFRVFRYNSLTWDQVGSDSETLTGGWVTGWQMFTLANPIEGVLAGDCLIIVITTSGTQNSAIAATTGLTAEDYEVLYHDSSLSGANKSPSQTLESCSLALEAYMDAPLWVAVGDSIMAGSPGFHSMLATLGGGTWQEHTPRTTLPAYLESYNPSLYQFLHHGIGSSGASEWATTGSDYITTHCIAYAPRNALIMLGINDIAGARTLSQYQTDMENIVQTLRANSIIPWVCTITPYHNGTDQQQASVQTWNDWLRVWCASLGICCIDTWEAVNSWADPDLLNAASPDFLGSDATVHITTLGYQALAMAVAGTIAARGQLVASDNQYVKGVDADTAQQTNAGIGVLDDATTDHATAGTFGKAIIDTLADTNEVQGKLPSRAYLAGSAAATGEVQTDAAAAITAYDPPTNAEMVLRTKLAADYADKTTLDTAAADVAGLDGAVMRGTDGAYTGTPPTAASIATAVWAVLTSALTATGSIGKWMLDKLLDATQVTGAFPTAALVNAPTAATASYTVSTTSTGTAPTVDITQYQYAAFGPVAITATTAQTGDSHSFLVYDPAAPATVLWSLTTAGGEISVGGTGNYTITIVGATADPDQRTATAGVYAYILRNTTDDTVVCIGTLTIEPVPTA